MHEYRIRQAIRDGVRQSILEGESETLSDAIERTEVAIDLLEGLRGEFRDDLLALANDLKMDLLAARCEVEEKLAVYSKREYAAQNAEYRRSVGY